MGANNVMIKGVIVAVMVVIMLIPIQLVKSLVEEREEYKETVENEISSKWGGRQHLVGPILVLPYTEVETQSIITNEIEKVVSVSKVEVTKYAYFLPDNLTIDGSVDTEERQRTLYKALVYQSKMSINGSFAFPDYKKLHIKAEDIRWNEAFLLISISNLQGIKNKISVDVNGNTLDVQPGISENDIIRSGVTVKMPIDPNTDVDNYNFKFDLILNGMNDLSFSPIGKETQVKLRSDWETVSYIGEFLPTKHDSENGFNAQWDVLDYNRNYPQMWTGRNIELENSRLGVEIRMEVNQYQKNMRAVKYAIMFITLTFVAFFLVELLGKKKIHPLQYILVSFALILFYTLLLSLSEHIGFGLAYLISAGAIISMITVYVISIFRSNIQAIFMGIFLVVLYTFLYVLLQLEDMALLFGSIGLFIALAAIMYASRKIDWYNLGGKNNLSNEAKKVAVGSIPSTPPPFVAPEERKEEK